MIAIFAAALASLAQSDQVPPSPCEASNSTVTSVAEIAQNPARYVGRCVTVTAASSGASLYQDIDFIYLGRSPAPFSDAHGERGRIGLYARDRQPSLRELARGGPLRLTVTGIVDTCEAKQARIEADFERHREPDAILLPSLGGYCHWFGGPFIALATYVRDESARYERLTGDEARRRVGDLVPATPETPGFDALRAFANEFAAAVRNGDRASLIALHDMQADRLSVDDRGAIAYLLDDPDSPFAALRAGQGGAPALFAIRGASEERDGGPSGVICFCRSADCAGRWPIASADAGNGPERPYMCTSLVPRDWRPRRAGLETPQDPGWLHEPARTAFRGAEGGPTR
jgi:hypothetical protein